ncbi:MAG: hypothetical protein HRT66_04995 [Flavobacteriaceae bacterium]|nr:hypothetical protein [Flavobacteriaceae bacterium]
MVSVMRKIEKQLIKIRVGTTFKYQQLSIAPNEYGAATKAIERFISEGMIKRISTGVFYKPLQTVFGELIPNEDELLKSYLFKNNKRIAYVTGISLYNKMGLTTQVSKSIKIACRDKRITISIGNIKGSPVKSYIDVTSNNFHLLGFLDALKDFKKIPNLDKKDGIIILTNILKGLDTNEIKLLIKSSLSYPPRVRAFLGALLEVLDIETINIKKSLNPLSEYNYTISEDLLSTVNNWNII